MKNTASPKKSKPNLIVSEGRTWRVEYDAQMRGLFAALIYCLVGGIPIVIWQIGRSVGALAEWLRRTRR